MTQPTSFRGVEENGFLVLAANTPWVYALAKSLAHHTPVSMVRFYDWANYRRLSPAWPDEASGLRRLTCTLPPGYAGKLEPLFRPFMQAFVSQESARLRRLTGADPVVICPYPYLAPWVRRFPNHQLVYYNLDDYSLYAPAKAARTRALEEELVERSQLTICLSIHQVEDLRRRVPQAGARIVHFPLGVLSEFINHDPKSARETAVGYIGNLTNRIDWRLVAGVATALPNIPFKFIGSLTDLETGRSSETWAAERQSAFALPNVEHLGPVPQSEVANHYWRYAINWMPYDTTHPFNVASCPTKIMDALASGRPFVSTPIPEVKLYKNHIHFAEDASSLAHTIKMLMAGPELHSAAQVAFAATQTWDHRAQTLLALVNSGSGR